MRTKSAHAHVDILQLYLTKRALEACISSCRATRVFMAKSSIVDKEESSVYNRQMKTAKFRVS